MSNNRDSNSRGKRWKIPGYLWIITKWLIIITIILIVIAFFVFLYPTLGTSNQSVFWLVFLLILVGIAMIGVYPVTYIAYRRYVDPVLENRLVDDFSALGLVSKNQVDLSVKNLYRTTYNPLQYWAYIGLITLSSSLLFLGFLFREQIGFIEPSTMTLMFFSYLGAYTFSIQELSRRYNTNDLRPQVYSSILVRILIAAAIVFAAAAVIDSSARQIVIAVDSDNALSTPIINEDPELTGLNTDSGEEVIVSDADPESPAVSEAVLRSDPNTPSLWAAILAFVIGFFPSRGTRWLTSRTNTILGDNMSNRPALPLQEIGGISPWHEARLVEMGIDDAQNLATVAISKMLLSTRFDTQQVVNWIDQAILYARVRDKYLLFCSAGISTFHEYRVCISLLEEDDDYFDRLLTMLKMSKIQELYELADFSNYPNYAHILHYYLNKSDIVSQRATIGTQQLLEAEGKKEFAELTENIKQRLRHFPDDASLWVKLGISRFGEGNIDRALEHLSKAIELDPTLADAYSNRAPIYFKKNQFRETIADTDIAIELNPRNKHSYYYRGLAYLLTEEPDINKAIDNFTQALLIDERFSVAYLNRGIANNRLNRHVQALEDFKYAHLLGDRSTYTLWLNWGKAYIGIRDYQEAIQKLSAALSINKSGTEAFANRGVAYYAIDDFHNAKMDLITTIEVGNPETENTLILDAKSNLGSVEMRLGDIETAIDYFNFVLDEEPGRFVTRLNLADVYEKQGEFDTALKHYKYLLSDDRELHSVNIVKRALINLIEKGYNKARLFESEQDNEEACKWFLWVVENAPDDFEVKQEARAKLDMLCNETTKN